MPSVSPSRRRNAGIDRGDHVDDRIADGEHVEVCVSHRPALLVSAPGDNRTHASGNKPQSASSPRSSSGKNPTATPATSGRRRLRLEPAPFGDDASGSIRASAPCRCSGRAGSASGGRGVLYCVGHHLISFSSTSSASLPGARPAGWRRGRRACRRPWRARRTPRSAPRWRSCARPRAALPAPRGRTAPRRRDCSIRMLR